MPIISWSPILHFYQPPTQDQEVIRTVTRTNYLPVLKFLAENPTLRFTVNIAGSLLEHFATQGELDIISLLKLLIGRNQIEIITSPFYHPLLPLVSKKTAQRQLDRMVNYTEELLGTKPLPILLPPELAATPDVIQNCGDTFDYIIVSETSVVPSRSFTSLPPLPIVTYNGKKLIINSHAITEILRAHPKDIDPQKFVDYVRSHTKPNAHIVSVNDIELFGHHYIDRLRLFTTLMTSEQLLILPLSELLENAPAPKPIDTFLASTWTTSPHSEAFSLWDNPQNSLQKEYNAFTRFVESRVDALNLNSLDPGLSSYITTNFDKGVSSCHPYWISNWPWWHPRLTDKGARRLISALRAIPDDAHNQLIGEEMYAKLCLHMWQFHWKKSYKKGYQAYDEYRKTSLESLPNLS